MEGNILDILKEAIKGPEFWMSFAFFVVIIVAFRPIGRYLKIWGEKHAAEIQARLDQPAQLRKNAQELLEKYEERTKNREIEYREIMKQAEAEIDFLQQDFDQKLKDRLSRKDKETEVRLQMIHDNGVKEMKNGMLKLVINRTYEILSHHHKTKKDASGEIDKALDSIYDTLKQNMHLVRK